MSNQIPWQSASKWSPDVNQKEKYLKGNDLGLLCRLIKKNKKASYLHNFLFCQYFLLISVRFYNQAKMFTFRNIYLIHSFLRFSWQFWQLCWLVLMGETSGLHLTFWGVWLLDCSCVSGTTIIFDFLTSLTIFSTSVLDIFRFRIKPKPKLCRQLNNCHTSRRKTKV